MQVKSHLQHLKCAEIEDASRVSVESNPSAQVMNQLDFVHIVQAVILWLQNIPTDSY